MSLREINAAKIRTLLDGYFTTSMPALNADHPAKNEHPPDEIVYSDELNPNTGVRITKGITIEGILETFGLADLAEETPITLATLRQIDPDDLAGYKVVLEQVMGITIP